MLTKQQEINALREFAQKFPHDSYIGMFLTPELLSRFETETNGDMTFDLIDRYDHVNELLHDSENKNNTASKEIERLDNRLAEKNETIRENNHRHESEIESLRDERNRSYKSVNTLINQINDLTTKNRQLEEENLKLKAKLYDLTTEE